jgi:hypothetical protein
VDIGGHPPFPTGSKQFSGNFGNLLFLAGFNFRGHFEGLNSPYASSYETVNIHNEPVQFWYPVLYKHKASFNFCIVQDKFVREFKHILVGAEPKRITQEAEDFLKEKGICIQEQSHTYIRLYGLSRKPTSTPYIFLR